MSDDQDEKRAPHFGSAFESISLISRKGAERDTSRAPLYAASWCCRRLVESQFIALEPGASSRGFGLSHIMLVPEWPRNCVDDINNSSCVPHQRNISGKLLWQQVHRSRRPLRSSFLICRRSLEWRNRDPPVAGDRRPSAWEIEEKAWSFLSLLYRLALVQASTNTVLCG